MKRTKQEAQETKKAILQSALNTFYEKGYSKTTFEEIASNIGLTKGAVYWYFKNKPDLLTALINEYIEAKKQYLAIKVPTLNHFKDIRNYFLYSVDFILSDEKYLKSAFFFCLQMEWSETIITKILEEAKETKEYFCRQMIGCLTSMQKNGEIRDDMDVELISSIIINIWTGNLEAYLSKRCTVDLKEMIEKSFDLLLNGLQKKG